MKKVVFKKTVAKIIKRRQPAMDKHVDKDKIWRIKKIKNHKCVVIDLYT